MNTRFRDNESSIADCLQRCVKGVRAIDGGWQFELRGDVPLTVTARLKKGWLRLLSTLGTQSSSRPTLEILDQMLAQNAKMAGGAKFTLAGDPPVPCLSAEIPFDEEETDIEAGIARAGDGFGQALQEFAGGLKARRGESVAPLLSAVTSGTGFKGAARSRRKHAPSRENGCYTGTFPDREGTATAENVQATCDQVGFGETEIDVVAVCRETGWPLTERPGNQVAVELDVPGCFCEALLRPNGPNGLRLGIELARGSSVGAVNRHALNVMLLHACHFVRMARAVARKQGDETAYGWEVSLEHVAAAGDVERAFEALSVACRLSAREVSMLQQDESLARRYLILRGWCS